jgi:hypothetical protein
MTSAPATVVHREISPYAAGLAPSPTFPLMTPVRARDLIFTVCARANYESLVELLGWGEEDYERWLTDTLSYALLPDA